MTEDFFTITRAWLHAHSTPGGGWTAEQLAVFDIPWPPQKGWLSGLVGKAISIDQKKKFEDVYAARQAYRRDVKLANAYKQRPSFPAFEVTVTIKPK